MLFENLHYSLKVTRRLFIYLFHEQYILYRLVKWFQCGKFENLQIKCESFTLWLFCTSLHVWAWHVMHWSKTSFMASFEWIKCAQRCIFPVGIIVFVEAIRGDIVCECIGMGRHTQHAENFVYAQKSARPRLGVTKHLTARTAYTARTALLADANGG